ncbi:MAG: restriction endonuclease subunit S, partial [Neisseriaceae bacterium]|nr:restriction endonuclease subunit S [Neisseriaceae bacterium]
MSKFNLNLNDREWGEFFITDIFPKIQRGKRLIRENQISGIIPYVSSSALNNGVDNFIQVNHSSMRQFENCISLANSGSVGSAF